MVSRVGQAMFEDMQPWGKAGRRSAVSISRDARACNIADPKGSGAYAMIKWD